MSQTPATPQQKHAWEVAYAPASDAYIKDQSIIRPAFEYLRQYNGVHETFSGIEIESPSILVAINWDSIEAHEAYKKEPAYHTRRGACGKIDRGVHRVTVILV
ncbi:hypothetical protein FA95DRAFT_1680081 [Auriscalpium vulgare]|uniref:Uncharacterized protein n=1 Tax=Auriscalpium vulgare TaxID=40419 RepID=A0ACB8RP44_9AGAM|nr:hypothetical protein FA95DRAFT_1680081 [Auriscalpium vulgare]